MEAKTKQFQYEIQSYQEECVANIVSIFQKLNQKCCFIDILEEHHKKHNYKFPIQF